MEYLIWKLLITGHTLLWSELTIFTITNLLIKLEDVIYMVLGMMLLTAASIYGLKQVASDTKTFMLQRDLHDRGPINVERDFDLICMICRIRCVSYPSLIGGEDTEVLPENGADKAYEFIMQEPFTEISDFDRFCKVYNNVREQQIAKQKEIWNNEYLEVVNSLNFSNELITFRKRVIGISISHDELIERLYSKTVLGDIAPKPGKAVIENNRSGKLHVWAFRGVKSFEAEKLYKDCCRKVGVDLY